MFQKVAAAVYAQKGKSKSKILETLKSWIRLPPNQELALVFELP